MRPIIKLRIADKELFFGPGVAALLRAVDDCGNVREACEKCGFSYSKAWKIIRQAEKEFGYAIVDRQAGGSSGGRASVTDKGHALLKAYDELLADLRSVAEERFRELEVKYGLGRDESFSPEDNTEDKVL